MTAEVFVVGPGQPTQQPDAVQAATAQVADASQGTQTATDASLGLTQPLGPLSKAKTKGGAPAKTPPVKAMPTQVAQPQVHPGQPAAKAPTVLTPPPDLLQLAVQAQEQPQTSQPTPDPPMAGSFPPVAGSQAPAEFSRLQVSCGSRPQTWHSRSVSLSRLQSTLVA